jgi:hypothetical protein
LAGICHDCCKLLQRVQHGQPATLLAGTWYRISQGTASRCRISYHERTAAPNEHEANKIRHALLRNSTRRLDAQLEIGESESGNFPAGPRSNLRCSHTTPDRPGSSDLQLLTREMAPMPASVRCCHNSQARCCGYTSRVQPPTEECVGLFSFCAAFEKKLTRHGAVTAGARGNVAAPGEEKNNRRHAKHPTHSTRDSRWRLQLQSGTICSGFKCIRHAPVQLLVINSMEAAGGPSDARTCGPRKYCD